MVQMQWNSNNQNDTYLQSKTPSWREPLKVDTENFSRVTVCKQNNVEHKKPSLQTMMPKSHMVDCMRKVMSSTVLTSIQFWVSWRARSVSNALSFVQLGLLDPFEAIASRLQYNWKLLSLWQWGSFYPTGILCNGWQRMATDVGPVLYNVAGTGFRIATSDPMHNSSSKAIRIPLHL